jgi:hypothetical protein
LTNRNVECRVQKDPHKMFHPAKWVFGELLRSLYCGLEGSANSEQYGAFLEEYFFLIFQEEAVSLGAWIT